MGLPLDPVSGLFPETLQEPFIEAPELEALAEQVLAAYDEFEPIRTAMREAGLRIAYAWETKPFDPLKEDIKPHTIAKLTKASPLWRLLAATELAIQFRRAFWDPFSDDQRRAVVHHELTHIEVDEPDEQGRIHLSLRKHDVEDFTRTMRRFGPIIPGRAAFVKAFLDWQHEQDRPEPTPLRSVAADAPGSHGITGITISTSGPVLGSRSVTIDAAAAKRIRKAAGLGDPAADAMSALADLVDAGGEDGPPA